MIVRRPIAVLLIALAATACSKKADQTVIAAPSGTIAAVPPPTGNQWTNIISPTPEGGMRMGNPDAPIKLVEYGAFTCPHCAAFEKDAADTLTQKYVSTGKVSWEFRSMAIHGAADVAITLLMNCRGADPYFQLSKQLYSTQETWFSPANLDKLNADTARLQTLPPGEQFKGYIEALGLYSFFAARGLPRTQAESCLTDQKSIDKIANQQQTYSTVDNVSSTPTFFINKAMWVPSEETKPVWPQLETELAKLTR